MIRPAQVWLAVEPVDKSSAALHKHPTPCEELWKRKKKVATK